MCTMTEGDWLASGSVVGGRRQLRMDRPKDASRTLEEVARVGCVGSKKLCNAEQRRFLSRAKLALLACPAPSAARAQVCFVVARDVLL